MPKICEINSARSMKIGVLNDICIMLHVSHLCRAKDLSTEGLTLKLYFNLKLKSD